MTSQAMMETAKYLRSIDETVLAEKFEVAARDRYAPVDLTTDELERLSRLTLPQLVSADVQSLLGGREL